ncbi:MAG: septal ring lytic transglycosylase RlpA family protein [Methylococcus sp.]
MINKLALVLTLSVSMPALAYQETGRASWYGPGLQGHRTASGQRFNKHQFTAAHKTLPLHTLVRVTNLANDESVIVEINDRGPHHRGRLIDLSQAAARAIGIRGVGNVKVTALN